ncbi:MAG: hypothetical protein JO060_01975 [Candidatus Eremiobacteraeota bacterium]|nr:hypothetical protein [Candidatus Eremiobacteraeota bacterium]
MRTALRPLSIGELLDRAVTLSVRYFPPLALIWVFYIVPLSVLGYLATAESTNIVFVALGQVMRGSSADPRVMQQLAAGPHLGAAFTWYIVVALLGYPLANAALLRSTSEAYLDGHAATLKQAYRDGVRQWLSLIGISLIWLAVGLLLYLAFVLIAVLFAVPLTLLIATAKPIGTTLAIVLGLVAVFAILIAGTLGILAFQIACITQVVEKVGFIRAFTMGLSRVAGRQRLRSFAYGLSLFAVYVGVWLVSALGQGLVIGLLRSPVVSSILAAVIGVGFSVVAAALEVNYYYDVRIRNEGFDLERAAASEAIATS